MAATVPTKMRSAENGDDNHEQGCWKDSANTASIKRTNPEAAALVGLPQDDSGDHVPRDDEEDVNANVTLRRNFTPECSKATRSTAIARRPWMSGRKRRSSGGVPASKAGFNSSPWSSDPEALLSRRSAVLVLPRF